MKENPIMVRAEITRDEWKALRQLAIQSDEPVQRIVGRLISKYLFAHGYEALQEEEA